MEMGQMQQTPQVQHVLVAEHIHELQREAAALRAERARRPSERRRRSGPGPRRRIGHWLIGIGIAIAGRSADDHAEARDPMATPV